MSSANVYLKCQRSVQLSSAEVFLKDLCNLRCADPVISAKLRSLKVHSFRKGEEKRHVISSLRLIELMEQACPNITVEVIGETDVLVEYRQDKKASAVFSSLKILLVCMVTFLGTAFTIIAYHNDIGINAIFRTLGKMILNEVPAGVTGLEIAYSVGLTVGMLLFFNHIGGDTITDDPTPIQVAMRSYEKDVDTSLVEMAQRNAKEEENKA